MARIILSTSNVMNDGSTITPRLTFQKSNIEFTKSLRANFDAARQNVIADTAAAAAATDTANNHATNGQDIDTDPTSWTKWEGNTLFVPALDFSSTGILEEPAQYDITVKLFYLPTTKVSKRCAYTQEAIDLVLKELHAPSIDLLIISFAGISYDADDDEDEIPEDDRDAACQLDEMVQIWRTLEHMHARGVVRQIGLSEFGSDRLQRFLPRTKVHPSVDQINLRDCCVIPKSLILYAKTEKIELLTHNDCTDILPKGTIRDLLGPGEKGADLISKKGFESLSKEIEPQWVIKYTAVVRDRGVIENKGYFAMAEIGD